jgi:hypothetical protein
MLLDKAAVGRLRGYAVVVGLERRGGPAVDMRGVAVNDREKGGINIERPNRASTCSRNGMGARVLGKATRATVRKRVQGFLNVTGRGPKLRAIYRRQISDRNFAR